MATVTLHVIGSSHPCRTVGQPTPRQVAEAGHVGFGRAPAQPQVAAPRVEPARTPPPAAVTGRSA